MRTTPGGFATTAALLLGVLAASPPAFAHNKYKEVTTQAPVEDTFAGNGGWTDGTRNVLGDSHHVLGGGSYFYFFHLDQAARVTVRFETVPVTVGATTYPAGLDPAFSLYQGLLGLLSHDETSYDPLNPVDDVYFLPMMSIRDAAPGDPDIAYCIDDGTNSGVFIENPAWNTPSAALGGETPAQWYAANYTPHNGYRDTLNYTTTGGVYPPGTIDTDGSVSGAPGTDVSCWVKHPYAGQFDALGSWTMANAYAVIGEPTIPSQCPIADCPQGNPVGDWAKLTYVGHANAHVGTGGTRDTTAEVLADQLLGPGDYTIVAGDGCVGCAPGAFFGGRVSITIPTVDLASGKGLVLKGKAGEPAKSSLVLASKDASLSIGNGNGSGDDPTLSGATIRIRSVAGGFDHTYGLPAANWKLVGKPGQNKGYKYADKSFTAGAIQSAALTFGKSNGLKVVAKGATLDAGLATDPDPIEVTMTLGTHSYCLAFGGTTSWKADTKFTAKNAAAPSACAP